MAKMNGWTRLNNAMTNKGTAFTAAERREYGLEGLLPTAIQTLAEQSEQAYQQFLKRSDAMSQHRFLMSLYDTNRVLFYYLVNHHVSEMLPIIYTPTIGDAVMQYNEDYTTPKDALFLSINDAPATIERIIKQRADLQPNVKMVVITDGEGVLGIGDWGINGVNISIGKLAVYTVAANVNPADVLPVVLDVGTNNEQLLANPFYLGNRHARIGGTIYDGFIENVVKAMTTTYPNVLLHWEDFGRANAARILAKYQPDYLTFNDDIQGTGIMVVAAALAASQAADIQLKEQRVLIFGGGTAGVGVATQLLDEMTRQSGSDQCKQQLHLFDREGLVLQSQPNLTTGQQLFAQDDANFSCDTGNLAAVIRAVKPTMLIGSSGVPGAFTQEVIEAMVAHCERPAIIPLSNPTRLSEATPADIIEWTKGQALVVTGSPFAPVTYNGQTYTIGQANNALLYPGLGLGAVAAQAQSVTMAMLSAAANAVADLVDASIPGASLLPNVADLKTASFAVAVAVVKQAIADGVSAVKLADAEAVVRAQMWQAQY
ncbi:NAD-dependent malic enzyme [Brochothrix campestris]|nr:NAD-dependent malic enzyme [Brochothrix campestris]